MDANIFSLNGDVELTHWWFAARRRIIGDLVSLVVPPSRDHTIVDVGCGTGANIASLGDRYSVVGIDPSREAVALARRRFPNVRFLEGFAPRDLGRINCAAKLFVLSDVLEHVRDDFLLFSQLLQSAAPGAHFLVTVPANLSLWGLHDVRHGHYRRYDKERLRGLWSGLPV